MPRDVRETIDLLRREAHVAGKPELARMFTASLIRIDEEAEAVRRALKGTKGNEPA
jgi:hypothetical protein